MPPATAAGTRPGANARTATGDWPTAAVRQGQGAGGTPHHIPIRHLGNGSPLTNWKYCFSFSLLWFLLGLAMFLHNLYTAHEIAIIHLGENNLCPVITSLCIQVSGSRHHVQSLLFDF